MMNVRSGWVVPVQNSRVKGVSCLIDTDIAVDFLRRREYARALLGFWADKGLLAISTLTHIEIYQGMKSGEEKATDAFLHGLVSIVIDMPIAWRASKLLGGLRSGGVIIGIADTIIAATALQLGVPLLTNSIERYPFEELKVLRGRVIDTFSI
jgi:predicted nucleic acid-binding protein